MARLSTCKQCGKKIANEDRKTYQGKYFCLDCYYQKVCESEQYKLLVSFINDIAKSQGINTPTFIYKQIKDYKSEYGFDYFGIRYTLWYIINILKQNIVLEDHGIALVQYEYYNAEKWYINQELLSQKVNNTNLDIRTKTIKSFNKNKSKTYIPIDLEKIVKK